MIEFETVKEVIWSLMVYGSIIVIGVVSICVIGLIGKWFWKVLTG